MSSTPKTPSATPASSGQDELYRIVEQFYLHTGKAYSEAEHLDYMDEAIAALRTYISQHYVPIGQASDEGLDRILVCNCGGNEYLNGSHYDDCAKNLKPALLAWRDQHTKEAVKAYENKVQDFAIETYVNSKVYAWAESRKHPKTNQNRYIGLEGAGYNSAQQEIEELLPKWRAEAALASEKKEGGDGK